MGVGKVGGGGRKGGAGGARGAGGAGGVAGVGKASGAGFAGRVERSESLAGPSGLVGSGNVQGVDPVTAQALDIARQLRAGQIKSKEEATKKLVAEVLRQKVRMQSKALTQRIADTLQEDPRLNQALERLWAKAE
ncbi:MAG: hypothetical protein HYZ28_01165 [Myxococcales bacterium]|nr:hypothetical protein [Myxococcales bacterium]